MAGYLASLLDIRNQPSHWFREQLTARLPDLEPFEADDPPEPVGRQLTFVDEAIQRARGDPEPSSRLSRAHPLNFVH